MFKELAEKYNLDERVVAEICYSPFRYAKQVIQDHTDEKDIRFPYLFKLRLKRRYVGQNIKKELPSRMRKCIENI